MKVVLDFDDVIFNANAFKELMFFYLAERGIKNARNVYDDMRREEEVFSVVRYLDELGIKEEERDEVYEGIMTPCAWLVNKEVITIMEELGEENIFILSQGEEAYQRDKIDRAVGDKVLGSHIAIVSESKTEELRKICEAYRDEEVIFADDKAKFLNALPVASLPNLKTVLFDKHGLETLRAEMAESRRVEKEKLSPEISRAGPKMR